MKSLSGKYPYNYERKRALEAFANHRLTVEHDDGVHRCLLFKAPDTSAYHFRLVTWPGHLAISGDIGDFTFARTWDMFQFFATHENWASMPVKINPQYWEEKCTARSRHGGTEEFDEGAFREYIVRTFHEIEADEFREGGRGAVWRDDRGYLLDTSFSTPHEAIQAAQEFRVDCWQLNDDVAHPADWHPFQDAWDCRFTKPGFTFLMCCYAIVWGIKRYAQHKEGKGQAAHDHRVLAGAI